MSLEDIRGGGFKILVLAPLEVVLVLLPPPLITEDAAEDGATDAPEDPNVGPPDDDDIIPPVVFIDELFVAAKGCSASVLDLMLLKKINQNNIVPMYIPILYITQLQKKTTVKSRQFG